MSKHRLACSAPDWRHRLPRTAQCAKCPWIKGSDPFTIPRGYDLDKHKALAGTIADPDNVPGQLTRPLRIMGCHEHDSDERVPCVGWLHNQLHHGNNVMLRIDLRNCTNLRQLRLRGEQHETFNDTLPLNDDTP